MLRYTKAIVLNLLLAVLITRIWSRGSVGTLNGTVLGPVMP
jgi:hypothetical protein